MYSDVPLFFVPGADDAEKAWLELHARSESGIGQRYSDRRIFSISFVQDGIDYEAEVGSPRQASEYRYKRGRKDYSHPPRKYSSGNVVMAILAPVEEGRPYLIWELPEGVSQWSNPALVGPSAIRNVREFTMPEEAY